MTTKAVQEIIAILFMGVATSAPARGEELAQPTVRLEFNSAVLECRLDDLRRTVAVQLGREPFVEQSPETWTVVVTRAENGLSAEIRTGGAERRLHNVHADCKQLMSDVGAALAVALESSFFASTEPAKPRLPIETLWVEPAAQPSLRGSIALGVGVLVGATPAATPGVTLEGAISRDFWSLAVGGSAGWPRQAKKRDADIRAGIISGHLAPCLNQGLFQECLIIAAGVLRAEAPSLTGAHRFQAPYVATGGRVGGKIAIGGGLSLYATMALLAVVTTTTLQVDDRDVWRSPPLAFEGSVGISTDLVTETRATGQK